MHATSLAHLILLDLMVLIIFGVVFTLEFSVGNKSAATKKWTRQRKTAYRVKAAIR
jgi:hypothetical protein